MIEDRSYGKGRARHALLFHRYPRVALNRLVRWINRCPELKQSLCSGYASKFSHFYTRQQVAEIIEFLDEPLKKSPWKGMHTTHYAYPFQGELIKLQSQQ